MRSDPNHDVVKDEGRSGVAYEEANKQIVSESDGGLSSRATQNVSMIGRKVKKSRWQGQRRP